MSWLALALSAAALAIAVPAQDDEAAIRALREEFNGAIAARQTARFGEFLQPDLEAVGGNGTAIHGPGAYASLIEQLAENPEFGTYVRTPDEVIVGVTGDLAAESGTWKGTWRRGDEETVAGGRYLAQWRKTESGWRIRAELYVGLRCSGYFCAELRLAPAPGRE